MNTVDFDPASLLPGISDYVLKYGMELPDRVAMRSEYGEITYRQLAERVNRLALALKRSGVERGERVAVLTTPRADAYTLFLAVNAIGAIWVGINPVYQYKEMKYVVDDASPVALVFLSEFRGRSYLEEVQGLHAECASLQQVYCLDTGDTDFPSLQGLVEEQTSAGESLPSSCQRHPEDVAMLVYTSGSTGEPKGCMLPNRAMAYRAFTQWTQFRVSDYPRVYCPLPLNHVGGMQMVAGATLFAGGTVNFAEKFEPADVGSIVRRGKINFMVLFPTMYQLILDDPSFDAEDWQSLECINFSGGVISRELLGRLASLGVGNVCTCFGSTETCIGVVFSEPGLDLDTLSISVGKPIRDDVRVVKDDGTPCVEGEIGEFQVVPDYCMTGYFNRPQATEAAFTADGWLKTGDLVEVLPSGDFRFSARVSDMYKSGGYNVYPREVEILLESHESVVTAAVVGVPDPLYGETGYAFLQLCPGAEVEPTTFVRWCKERLSGYKAPKFVQVLDGMPLLPNGKLDKVALKRLGADSVAQV